MSSLALPSLKPTPIRDIAWLFLGTRLLLIVATYMSFILFPVPPHIYPNTGVDLAALLTSWNHWDAVHYTQIAQFGYQTSSETAFFPLFPLLVKGLALLFGNQHFTLASMLISNLALFGTLYMLYQIATDALGEQVGLRTILYLCIFPTALFFFAGYNESLFLFFSCTAFFAMRRQKWLLAGAMGLLAAVTRSAGILLVLPYLYELWLARDISQPNWLKQGIKLLPKALPIVLIPAGLLVYCYYCWRHFGSPIAFVRAEQDWQRVSAFPWVGLFHAIANLLRHQPFGSFMEVHTLIDLTATLGFIALAILGARRLRLSYTIWIVVLLIFILSSSSPTLPDTLWANQRYVLEMFPGFITLAALGVKYKRIHQAIIITFPFLQAIFVALFVLNRWIV